MGLPTGRIFKVVIGGNIGAEQWSIGTWSRDTNSVNPTPTQLNTYAASCLAAFNADVWSLASFGARTVNSSDTTLAQCKVYYYSGGVLIGLGTATITPVVGTGSATPHPAYVAMCVSLLTAFPGKSHRGRVYLPATAAPVNGATSQFSSSTPLTQLAAAMAAYLTDATTAVPPWGTGNVINVIVSQTLAATTDTTSLRIDSLPDTQHGRSRKLIATTIATHSVP